MEWRDRLYLFAFYPLDELRKKAYQFAIFIFTLGVVIGGYAFHAAKAEEVVLDDTKTQVDAKPSLLSSKVERSLLNHPTLRQTAARSCRAVFDVGQVKAQKRVNFGAEISGEREIFGNFRGDEADQSVTSRRAFNANDDDVIDLEVTARYTLYDFGVLDARLRGNQSNLAAERLSYRAQFSENIQNLLRIVMQLKSALDEVEIRSSMLTEIASHVEAIEAQGRAGSIGLADVRATKLMVLDGEVALQRAQRRVAETQEELRSSFQLTFDEAYPVLTAFIDHRSVMPPEIDASDWLPVRITDQRIIAERENLVAIENELFPRIDGVVESTIFDLSDYESEYQMVGRIEMTFPLYDGGANRARAMEKSWRVNELLSQRDEQVREHIRNVAQGKVIMQRRVDEIDKVKEQLGDIEGRYESLLALVGNSLVRRQDIIQLIIQKTEKITELTQLNWQQEFGYVRSNFLADQITTTLGIRLGDNEC